MHPRLAERIDEPIMGKPAFLMVDTPGGYAYRRADGVLVVPIGCLMPQQRCSDAAEYPRSVQISLHLLHAVKKLANTAASNVPSPAVMRRGRGYTILPDEKACCYACLVCLTTCR